MKIKREITPNKLILLMILCAIIMSAILGGLSSCCRQISSTRSESDSTRVDIRYVEREVLKDTTIYIQVPAEKDMAITADSSYLSTSVSESWAKVDTLGHLYHTLQNKPVKIANTIQYVDREVARDSIVHRDKIVEVGRVQERKTNIFKIVLSCIGMLVIGFILGYCFKWIK